MSSRLPRDEALEKEDKIDEMKKTNKKSSPSAPHLLQAQQVRALQYAKVVGRPGTGSYPAPSPDPTTHHQQGDWAQIYVRKETGSLISRRTARRK